MLSNPWSEYFIISLECRFLPQEIYWLKDHSFAFFLSKEENDLSGFINRKTVSHKIPKLGVLIYRPKGELTVGTVRKTLDDFVSCFCLLKPDLMLFSALRAALEKLNQTFRENVRRTKNISGILEKEHFKRKNKKDGLGGFITDFTKIIYGFQAIVSINFLSAFQNYVDLEKSDKDYQAIKLLVLSGFSDPFTSKFYDNANLRYSLMFTLLESFLPKEKKQVQYKCRKCGASRTNKIDLPVSSRFSNYVDNLPIADSLKERAKQTFECMRPIRNKFYHDAEFNSDLGMVYDIKRITGSNTMTYKQDLELNEGRSLGPKFMEEFIRTILIVRLISKNGSDRLTEFQPNILWKNFNPLSVIGTVDISFSSLNSLHVGILDFKELEKRIQICKKDKVCNDREIRQYYFLNNQNSQSPIMILCSTPDRLNENCTEDQKELDWFKTTRNKKFSKILEALNLENIYITNLVKCGSTKKFDKNNLSVKNCWQFFLREIDLLNPKLILNAHPH